MAVYKDLIANKGKRTLVHLELLRIIAILLVIFHHTNTRGFFLFSVSEGSPLYPFYLFLSVACVMGVPLFFMASGALLLGREESIGTIYKKRVLRIAVVLVVVSFLYALYESAESGTPFRFADFIKTMYSSQVTYPLWFLYAYLALLMMLPFLRRLAKGMTGKEYIYLAGMSLLFVGVIPILQYRLTAGEVSINSNIRGALFTATSIVFFLMGYFLEHKLPEKYYTLKNAWIGIVLSLICIGVCCYMTTYQIGITGVSKEGSTSFHHSLIAIPAYTTYFCVRLFFMRRKQKREFRPWTLKTICFLGSMTFGIYLLEEFLRTETIFIFDAMQPVIRTLPACIVWVLIVFAIGVVLTYLIKKIPFVGKYI